MKPVTPAPTLVLMAGLPGSGKTTLASALAQVLRWPVLDKDRVNSVLLDAGLDQQQAAPLAYELVLALAQDLLVQQQMPVILDTAARQPFILERATALAQMGGAHLKVIRCVAPQPLRAERLAMRVAQPSQWVVDQATDSDQERWYRHLPPTTLVLTTDKPWQETLAKALAFLQGDAVD